MYNSKLALTIFVGSGLVSVATPAHASIEIKTAIKQVTQTDVIIPLTKKFRATGFVEITDPAGKKQRVDMPPEGGKIGASGPNGGLGNAIAGASVDPNTGRQSSGSVYLSDSGWKAEAKTDAHPYWVNGVPIVVTTTFTTTTQIIKTGPERVTIYFSPYVQGSIIWDLQFLELKTGTVFFNSHSVLFENSPDTVQDSAGIISWQRSPGRYDGLSGVDSNIITPDTEYSNNRWIMNFTPQNFNFDITLNPGDSLADYEFALVSSHSSTATGGSGYIGVGDAVPEPSTWAMLIAGFGFVGGALRYRRIDRIPAR